MAKNLVVKSWTGSGFRLTAAGVLYVSGNRAGKVDDPVVAREVLTSDCGGCIELAGGGRVFFPGRGRRTMSREVVRAAYARTPSRPKIKGGSR